MGLVKRTYVDGETVITADNLNDIQDEIIQNASDISTKGTYSKPSGGIPSTDLSSAVQTSLGKADTALQSSDIDNTLSVTGKAADAKKTGDEISDVRNTLNVSNDNIDGLSEAVYEKVYDDTISVDSSTVLHEMLGTIKNGQTASIVLTIEDASDLLSYASIILYETSSYTSSHDEVRLDHFNDESGFFDGRNYGVLSVTGNRKYIRFANFVSSGTVSVNVKVYIANELREITDTDLSESLRKSNGRNNYQNTVTAVISDYTFNSFYNTDLAVTSETVLHKMDETIVSGTNVLIALYISDVTALLSMAGTSVILYEGSLYTMAHDEIPLSTFNGGAGVANGWNYAVCAVTGNRSYIRFANFVSSGSVNVSVKVQNVDDAQQDGAVLTPINAFGDILPSAFKAKLDAMDDDLLVVCAGDSITAYVDTCNPQNDPSHCPPGQQYKDWVSQLQEYVTKNKPICDRLDSERSGNAVFSKSGTWTSEVPGETDTEAAFAEASKSALTFSCDSNAAGVGFYWDTSAHRKCNIIYSREPDGVLTKITVNEGNGKVLASLDRTTWTEANGFSVNQRTNLEGYDNSTLKNKGIPTRERHRRIWMKAVEGVTDTVRIVYARDNSTPYSDSKMYMWGTERYSNPTILFDNVGRGGRYTYMQIYFSRDITDRNPDLLLFEMPMINETRYTLTQQADAYNDYLNRTDKVNSLKYLTNNYEDLPMVFFVPHGRGGYFDDENRAIMWEPGNGTDQPAGQPPAYMFFIKTYQIVKGWFTENANVAWFNMFNRLYDESLAKYGLYKTAFSTNGKAFSSDGTHLSQKGANVYTKYIAGLFMQY